MNVDELAERLPKLPGYRGQIVHEEVLPPREAVYLDLDEPLSQELTDSLHDLGVDRFYAHQASAINAVRRGENVAVVTSTASGKTLCYNVPVLEDLVSHPRHRALYLFPTKALAQDQLSKFRAFKTLERVHADTYDGDTPFALRKAVRTESRMILTNPDMLHVGILPYHSAWASFFRNLHYVVIDEVHTYRGVFGSHVANVIRRLRRICRYYGSDPQFVCASATIANPAELVENLTGVRPVVIDNDGSPHGEKRFLFWNPPFVGDSGERRSVNLEATNLLVKLTKSEIRSIIFTLSRKQAELILRYARSELEAHWRELSDKVMAYRAGYTARDRREIERKLFSGELLAVTSTTALEMGVDIGGLDACVMAGYPGTIASTWQQAGRAGRGTEPSLAILIGSDNPLDQFLMKHPDYFFQKRPEHAIADPQNLYVLAAHLTCAAYELPLRNEESDLFGNRMFEALGALAEAGELTYRDRWYWKGRSYPAAAVNIRSASSDTYSIVSIDNGGTVMGTVDGSNAFITVHPGAVYLHAGESYVVEKLDLQQKAAFVSRGDVNYYTVPSSDTTIAVEQEVESRPIPTGTAHFGDISVTGVTTGYWKRQLGSDAILTYSSLDLPPEDFRTEGVWMVIPDRVADVLVGRGFDLPGSLHATEHACIGILPLLAMCDRQDIGGVSHPMHPDLDGHPGIFIYDAHPGGVGIAKVAYDRVEELLEATVNLVESCECEDGCPSCVQSPKCGNNNEPLDKAGAVFLLRELLK